MKLRYKLKLEGFQCVCHTFVGGLEYCCTMVYLPFFYYWRLTSVLFCFVLFPLIADTVRVDEGFCYSMCMKAMKKICGSTLRTENGPA